jgi:ribosome maturation factor RimP
MKREEAVSKIRQIAELAAVDAGIEIVDVELKGSGRYQQLRIVIDKPGGVTHDDCKLIDHAVSDEVDTVDPIAGPYELEVSSPGVERPLKKWQDWERFVGQKVKVVLKTPLISSDQKPGRSVDLKNFEGAVFGAADQTITIELSDGHQVAFPFEQVSRANLKFEW